jgi:hypothetical protein
MNVVLHALLPTLGWYKTYVKDKWFLAMCILGGILPDAFSAYERIFIGDQWILRNWSHSWFGGMVVAMIIFCLLYIFKVFLTSNIFWIWFGFIWSYSLHILIDLLYHKPIVGGWYAWSYFVDYALFGLLCAYFIWSKEWPWKWFQSKNN